MNNPKQQSITRSSTTKSVRETRQIKQEIWIVISESWVQGVFWSSESAHKLANKLKNRYENKYPVKEVLVFQKQFKYIKP